MKYVLYNIRNLIKHEKFIFVVMLICIFVSAWIMTFSYGLYQNYHTLQIEGEETSKRADPQITDGETVTYGEIKKYLDALSNELLSDVNIILVISNYDFENSETPGDIIGTALCSRFTIKNGVYQSSPYITEIWETGGIIATGSLLSNNDEALGTPVIMIRKDELTNHFNRERNQNLIIDDNTAMLFGQKFTIKGTHTSFGIIVPFLSVPTEHAITNFGFTFEHIMTRKVYQELIDTANEIIPGKLIFPELTLPDSESVYIYNNIMMISVFIAALTIINFAFLYNFIFGKRRRQLAIMRICGCTAARSRIICLGECCLICVPVFLVGMLTYIPFMHNVLANYFEFMEASYSPRIYAAIFGIYFVTLIVIMGIFLLRQIGKTLAESRKEGA